MKGKGKEERFLWAKAQMLSPASFFRLNKGKMFINTRLSENNREWGEEKKSSRKLVFYCWETTSEEEVRMFLTSAKALWGIEACHCFIHKDTGYMANGEWISNPYVEISFGHEGRFPLSQAQRTLLENSWNKYEAALVVLGEMMGKEYTPHSFSPPDDWSNPPLDFMIELWASTIGKEQYPERGGKTTFRKKSIEDYVLQLRKNNYAAGMKLFSSRKKYHKFLLKYWFS